MTPKRNIVLALTVSGFAIATLGAPARAEIRTQTFDYKQGDATLEGYMAWDDARSGKLPGVLVVPAWNGTGDHERESARDLAKLGYVAMVADIYGKGIRPQTPKEAGAEAGKYIGNRPLYRARVTAGLDRLEENASVDKGDLAAIGYCFGGAGVLELARSGAPVKAFVTFHGDLSTPTPDDAKNIKGKVLVLHGADDPLVPKKAVDAFETEMRDAKADWQVVLYSGTVHAFTDPNAGSDPSKGSAYNAESAKRSWLAMQDFFKETLGK